MVDLTGDHEVKAICPRCSGNGFIRVHDKLGEDIDSMLCPQCGGEGWVMLPANQCRENIEGGIEPKWMKSGESI